MIRESRFISALHGSAVPVATPILACPEPDVIGAPFYVMAHVDGFVAQTGVPAEAETDEARRQISESAIDALAALHAIDHTTLDIPGRAGGGYLATARPVVHADRPDALDEPSRRSRRLDHAAAVELLTLDLDHVGAHVAEDLHRHRRHHDRGQLDDPDAR